MCFAHSRPLPRKRISELAMFLDFQACTNAAWDHKELCEAEYQAIRQRLEEAGLGSWIEEYLGRLRELESRRPSIGGDHRRFDDVRSYREAVARLSLGDGDRDRAGRRVSRRGDPGDSVRPRCGNALSDRDAVPDHRRRAGLHGGSVRGPAEFSDRVGVAVAGHGIDGRARHGPMPRAPSVHGSGVFPLRMALRVVTAVAKLVVRAGDRSRRPCRAGPLAPASIRVACRSIAARIASPCVSMGHAICSP